MAETGMAIPQPVVGQPQPKGVQPTEPDGVQAPESWKDEFHKVIEQRETFKKQSVAQLEELTKLRQFQSDIAAKDKALKDRLENEKLIEQGKYNEVIANKEKAHLEAQNAYRQRVAGKMIPNLIKAAALSIPNLTKEGLDDLPKLLKENLAIDDETLEIKVVDDNGAVMIDKTTGKEINAEQYIQDYVKARPYLLLDGIPKSTGAINPNTGHPSQHNGPLTTAEENEMAEKDPVGYAAMIKAQYDPKKLVAKARAKFKYPVQEM